MEWTLWGPPGSCPWSREREGGSDAQPEAARTHVQGPEIRVMGDRGGREGPVVLSCHHRAGVLLKVPPECEVRGEGHRREGPEQRRPPYTFPLKRFNA